MRARPPQDTDFDGRSDYDAFTQAGIPSGGLFAGAEENKTDDQAKLWGGEADKPFDPNYHKSTDTLDHIDRTALEIQGRGVAYAIGLYAQDLSRAQRRSRPRRPHPARGDGRHEAAAALAPCTRAVVVAACSSPPQAPQPSADPARELAGKVTVDGMYAHLHKLADIATANGNSRADGTPGYDASVDYVAGMLRDKGFDVADAGVRPVGPDRHRQADADRRRAAASPSTRRRCSSPPPAPVV